MPPKPSKASRSPSPPQKGGAKGSTTKKPPVKSSDVSPPTAPAPRGMTREAALVLIQSTGRGMLERIVQGVQHKKHLARKMEKESEERLFAHSRLERQRREKQKQLEKEAETKESQRRRLQEALNVASFDGNVAEMRKLVAQGADVHGKDAQGNNAIGEASVNGQVEAVRFLLAQGSDPNFRGEYDRTPLWRACFNNHSEVIKVLLENGADPRLKAQAQSPEELCGSEGKALIARWDLKTTDALVAKHASAAADREARRKAEAQAVADSLSAAADDAKAKLEAKKRELLHHKQEFEKRVIEYDLVCCEGKPPELTKVALDCIKSAEAEVARVSSELQSLQEDYFSARSRLALHNHAELGEELEGTVFPFKRLADVVFDDTDNLWKSSGKWPVIFDPSGKSRTFLKYRYVVFVDTFLPQQMEKNALRRSLLGALRYGKPLVIDLRDVPMISNVQEKFDAIRTGLYNDIVSKRILERDVFKGLLEPQNDGPEFAEDKFSVQTAHEAKVIFVSSAIGVDDAFGVDSFMFLRAED